MSRLLVLVDGDLGFNPSALPWCEVPWRAGSSACVVFALNTGSAPRFGGAFRQAAEDIVRRLCGTATVVESAQVRLEVAVALVMPESADVSLLQLLGASADPPADFDHVALVSKDTDLHLGITARLRCPPSTHPPVRVWARRWRRETGRTRGWHHAFTALFAGAAPGLTRGVWDAATAATSAARAVDAVDYPTFLAHVEQRPWWLSQIGITDTSLAGVARLTTLRGGVRPPLGPVFPGDGVVVDGVPVAEWPAVAFTVVAPASIGNGAVAAAGPEGVGTWRTRLPAPVIAAGGVNSSPASSVLPDSRILADLLGRADLVPVPACSGRVRLRFMKGKGARPLVAEVEGCPQSEPPLWWWAAGSTSAKLSVGCGRELMDGGLENIDAVAGVVPGPSLVLCSPVRPGAPLSYDNEDGPVPGAIVGAMSGPLRCAVIALPGLPGLLPRPIQSVAVDALRRALAKEWAGTGLGADVINTLVDGLRRMPIVVAAVSP